MFGERWTKDAYVVQFWKFLVGLGNVGMEARKHRSVIVISGDYSYVRYSQWHHIIKVKKTYKSERISVFLDVLSKRREVEGTSIKKIKNCR